MPVNCFEFDSLLKDIFPHRFLRYFNELGSKCIFWIHLSLKINDLSDEVNKKFGKLNY